MARIASEDLVRLADEHAGLVAGFRRLAAAFAQKAQDEIQFAQSDASISEVQAKELKRSIEFNRKMSLSFTKKAEISEGHLEFLRAEARRLHESERKP